MTVRTLLAAALLAGAAAGLSGGAASAECEPNPLRPGACPGRIQAIVDRVDGPYEVGCLNPLGCDG